MVEDVDDWPIVRRREVDSSVIGPIFGAYHTLHDRLRREMADAGLDATAGVVLSTVNREPMCSPVVLRRRLGFRRSTLTSILDRLERDGIVDRPRVSFEGQRFEVHITRAGRYPADFANAVIRELEAEIAGYTSTAERMAALGVFHACAAIDHPERRIR
jgi:DNA-binding MarR family transcriptional regulator